MPIELTAIRHLVELAGLEWQGQPTPLQHALIARGPISGIRTWISDGPVHITVTTRTAAPTAEELEQWDDVVVASAYLQEDAVVRGVEEEARPEGRLCHEPGLYTVLIAANNALKDYDAATTESDERYLVATWPAAGNATQIAERIGSARAAQYVAQPEERIARRAQSTDGLRVRFDPGDAEPGPVQQR